MELFPELRLVDLCKLVFQTAMGSEHAVTDTGLVLDRLKAESEAPAPNEALPMIMPISPDHQLVRVGVHPYLMAGGDLRDLGYENYKTF